MTVFTKQDFQSVWGAMKPDIITTRLFFDPLAVPLTILFSKVHWISANKVTFSALIPGLAGAFFFANGDFLSGAIAYYLFFLLDTVDGKLARLKGCADPLGAFYDFIVDRIVIGSMLIGQGFWFVIAEQWSEALLVQSFFFLFFLKDVFDLKWKETGTSRAEESISEERSGFFGKLKIHFKPGQLLSCFFIFFLGPLSGELAICAVFAILFVILSLIYNVLLPWMNYLKTGYRE